mgnify:CR=1 FL=1
MENRLPWIIYGIRRIIASAAATTAIAWVKSISLPTMDGRLFSSKSRRDDLSATAGPVRPLNGGSVRKLPVSLRAI